MARYTGPACKLCRREGVKLFLKGDRCLTGKCAMERRPVAPGQHGAETKKPREYGMQLREKQKTKRYYGVLENQFTGYFEKADNQEGVTGENLLSVLESRLDNVIYRLGFGTSRAEARRLILHGQFDVNGKRVDIPSYLVSPGEVISIREASKKSAKIKEILEITESKLVPDWLELNRDSLEAKVVSLASREHIDLPIEEHLIVELYSK
jgi:small subunit ribosomal protein S4